MRKKGDGVSEREKAKNVGPRAAYSTLESLANLWSDIRIDGQNLETVQSFKYLGSVTTDEGSKQKILSRIAQTVGALSKLKTIIIYGKTRTLPSAPKSE